MENKDDILQVINIIADAAPAQVEQPVVVPVAAGVVAGAVAEKKKKPGRPPKNMVNIPVEVHGIVAQPINQDDIIELIYGKPVLFKKICTLLKGYGVGEVELNFDRNGLKIETYDKLKKVKITVNISGLCMNLYYCKEPIKVWVKRESLERVFGSLGKNHIKVTWLLKNDYRKVLYLIVKEGDVNSDQIHEIDVFYKEVVQDQAKPNDDTNYPLKFKVSAKNFKKLLTDINKRSKIFTIQKTGREPLQFTIGKTQNQKDHWTEVFNDDKKIDLHSNIADDDLFNVSVDIANVIPFSKYSIGDDVYVAADNKEAISFYCLADKKEIGWAASIKIFAEIRKVNAQ